MSTTETYTHIDRHRMKTTLHNLGDVACVQVMDIQTRDPLACYVTVEQARAMAEWLNAWADRREDMSPDPAPSLEDVLREAKDKAESLWDAFDDLMDGPDRFALKNYGRWAMLAEERLLLQGLIVILHRHGVEDDVLEDVMWIDDTIRGVVIHSLPRDPRLVGPLVAASPRGNGWWHCFRP